VSQHATGAGDSYDRRVPTSPSTTPYAPVRRLHGLWLVPLVVGLTALTSCGDEAHPTAPAQAIGGVTARKTGPPAHLLAADKMPTAGAAWSATETAAGDVEVLGPCHVTSLVDIGALDAVRRTWSADASSPRAVQVVARFADNKSAWRAGQVLEAWRSDCADRVAGTVGPLREVAVSTGAGQAYRVAEGDRATDVGIVRKGEYLSVVTLVSSPAKLPEDSAVAKAAVKRIAATFRRGWA
jgi:hypothetical protein